MSDNELPPGVVAVTSRGFEDYAQFVDTYGHEIVVRESSAASGPHVWVFVRNCNDPRCCPSRPTSPAAHLNLEQATKVRDALDAFIKRAAERWSATLKETDE